jgi:hypothetical protein
MGSAMIKLDPLIALFVREVLQAVRGATLDEISDLFSEPGRPALLHHKAERPRQSLSRPARQSTRAPALPLRRSVAPRKAKERLVVAEITDPEALLAATTRPATSPTPLTRVRSAGKPPNGGAELSSSATPSLRAGETLVRTSGSGNVIRRAKRV